MEFAPGRRLHKSFEVVGRRGGGGSLNISDIKHSSRLCCGYSVFTICGTYNVISHEKRPYLYNSALRSMCAAPTMFFFSVVPWFRTFLVFCSGVVWMILRCFQLPLLLIGITFAFTFHIRCMCVVIRYTDLAYVLDHISVSSNRITRHFSVVAYWANGFAGRLSHGLWCTSSRMKSGKLKNVVQDGVSEAASYPRWKLLKETYSADNLLMGLIFN